MTTKEINKGEKIISEDNNKSIKKGDGIELSTITSALSGSTGGAVLGAAMGASGAIIGAVGIGFLVFVLASMSKDK